MIQILGKASPSKRHFIYTLATLLVSHYGKYEIYSESFVKDEVEDYTDKLRVRPLTEYCGQEHCIVEAETVALNIEPTICYLTPYEPELRAFMKYLQRIKPKEITVVYGEHIRESVLNERYLAKRISEQSPETKAKMLTIEWDKLNKLIENEGLVEGYYPLASLSGEYKNVLTEIICVITGISSKECKKYFRQERRKLR